MKYTKPAKPKESDESQAVNTLVKTLNATVMKLLYSYAALNADQAEAKSSASTSIATALAASKRDELCTKIAEALAGSVEKVIKCKDVTLRTMALKDLRARFVVPEKPKPEMMDQGVQAAPRKPKISVAAAANIAMANDSPSQVAFNSSFKKPTPSKLGGEEKKQPQPSPQMSDDDILKQLADGTSTAAASPSARSPSGFGKELATSSAGAANASSSNASSSKDAATGGAADGEGRKSRPGSGGTSGTVLPGIYERQMKWAAKAAERREQARVEKENKEREAEKGPDAKKGGRWAHVESVMRKQRVAAEEGWKAELHAEMQEEREMRYDAERRAREQAKEREQLERDKAKAEEMRKEAQAKMDAMQRKMQKAQAELALAKRAQEELSAKHAEELEVRDAFGDHGLEVWPMFPGRKVFRVLDGDEFDGRVSQEFRVKDPGSGERGVTLLMGRTAHSGVSEAQAILFDTERISDLQAARWWREHGARFEQVKERLQREKQRAQSAQPSSRAALSSDAVPAPPPKKASSSNYTEEFLLKHPGLR